MVQSGIKMPIRVPLTALRRSNRMGIGRDVNATFVALPNILITQNS